MCWKGFRDLEGNGQQICEPVLVRKRYLKRFNDHREQIEQTARAIGAEFQTFVTDRPLENSLTAFLRTRVNR